MQYERDEVKRSVVEAMRKQAKLHGGVDSGSFFIEYGTDDGVKDVPCCAYGLASAAGLIDRYRVQNAATNRELGFSYAKSDEAVRWVRARLRDDNPEQGLRVPFDMWLDRMNFIIVEDDA